MAGNENTGTSSSRSRSLALPHPELTSEAAKCSPSYALRFCASAAGERHREADPQYALPLPISHPAEPDRHLSDLGLPDRTRSRRTLRPTEAARLWQIVSESPRAGTREQCNPARCACRQRSSRRPAVNMYSFALLFYSMAGSGARPFTSLRPAETTFFGDHPPLFFAPSISNLAVSPR